jgi:D-glycero-D-manno-heptose 1,7-bisphosphate phosphatase
MPVENKPTQKAHAHTLFRSARFVFLDRDGVINRKQPEDQYVTDAAQIELLPGAAEAIARLNRSGRTVIVVTNQRGVALGRMSAAALDSVHAELRRQLALAGGSIDAIYVCPHNRGECLCRKPATGMIEAAFRDFAGANPANSILLGDSLSDIQCGRTAGIPTLFIEGEAEHRKPGAEAAAELSDAVAASLADAVPL